MTGGPWSTSAVRRGSATPVSPCAEVGARGSTHQSRLPKPRGGRDATVPEEVRPEGRDGVVGPDAVGGRPVPVSTREAGDQRGGWSTAGRRQDPPVGRVSTTCRPSVRGAPCDTEDDRYGVGGRGVDVLFPVPQSPTSRSLVPQSRRRFVAGSFESHKGVRTIFSSHSDTGRLSTASPSPVPLSSFSPTVRSLGQVPGRGRVEGGRVHVPLRPLPVTDEVLRPRVWELVSETAPSPSTGVVVRTVGDRHRPYKTYGGRGTVTQPGVSVPGPTGVGDTGRPDGPPARVHGGVHGRGLDVSYVVLPDDPLHGDCVTCRQGSRGDPARLQVVRGDSDGRPTDFVSIPFSTVPPSSPVSPWAKGLKDKG